MNQDRHIVVVGLGYVGVPLAAALARTYRTTGYDIDAERVEALAGGFDKNGSVSRDDLAVDGLTFSADPSVISPADVVIISVPTPVDDDKKPDLKPLTSASTTVGAHLSKGAIVVYESTVYPGVTEEICIPILERESGMSAGAGFTVGYSPERINPGDAAHSLNSIRKVISAQDERTLDVLDEVYSSVTSAGVYRAESIKIAEAAKVIENVQRDVNIALVNEFAVLFHRMGLNTRDILEAASTKWNFLRYSPGLVGGHCIGVDPYYLSHAAKEIGHETEIILAGRRTNDAMARFVVDAATRLLRESGKDAAKSSALVLGLTYKADVPDTRNSLVFQVISGLTDTLASVDVFDPLVDQAHVNGLLSRPQLQAMPQAGAYDAIVLAVPHSSFISTPPSSYVRLLNDNGGHPVMLDLYGAVNRAPLEQAGVRYWQL